MRRREFVPLAGAALLAGCTKISSTGGSKSVVTVLKAASYTAELADGIKRGIQACGLEVKGKRVVLKPNLVEFDRATAINTDVAVIAAALDVFKSLGAREVIIAEGPGHRRDTLGIAEEAGYRGAIANFENSFVDLNRDDVSPVKKFADKERIYLPNTALGADLLVSMPKLKTHHWAGATLSMKNLFGTVPSAIYGWPKNFLHHVGIDTSILELTRIFRNTFAIVDGITGMEGNGPIQGTPVHAGVLVMGRDLVAVDATCCRIMGIDPAKVTYLREAGELGNSGEESVEQRGEAPKAVRHDFALLPEFRSLRLA